MAILKSAEWGKRLGQHKVAYTEAFRGGLEERRKVAGALLRCREMDLDTVVKYCRFRVLLLIGVEIRACFFPAVRRWGTSHRRCS